MAGPGQGLTQQQEANRQRDGKFGAYGHSDRGLPQLVPAGSASAGGNFVPRGMTAEQAYPEAFGLQPAMADRDIRGALSGDGKTEKGYRLPPADKALVDSDLAGIMSDPSLSDADKAKFQDMAEQLDRFGTVHMALSGPPAIRFGRGSRYGGDKVPFKFASFYAKAEADARDRARRTSEALRPAVAATAQNITEAAAKPEKASALRRFLGR